MNVSKFVPRSKRTAELNPNKNLFIRNFPETWEEDKVREFLNEQFKAIGETTSIGVFSHFINSIAVFFLEF